MKEKEEPPSIAKMFMARRIAEFPTLYPCGDQVIFSCVVSTQGRCVWNKKGILEMPEQHYNPKTKKWTKFPLQMPIETAHSLVFSLNKLISPYYDMSGPINKMPENIEGSWLLQISIFLNKWGALSMEDFKAIATTDCLLNYGRRENPHAYSPQREIDDFSQFHKKIPSWKATVASIYHQKMTGKVDPKTFQGVGI